MGRFARLLAGLLLLGPLYAVLAGQAGGAPPQSVGQAQTYPDGRSPTGWVDVTHVAGRVSIRPLDHQGFGQVLGHYTANLITATTVSLSANSPIASIRWADPARLFVLMRIDASANVPSAITAATPVDLEAIVARGFTASDTTGTAITLSGNNQKNRTNQMSSSLVTDMRVTSSGTLTAGTRTLDSVGFGFANFGLVSSNATVGSASSTQTLYAWRDLGQYPIVLGYNEGLILRNSTAGPTTGGIRYAITLTWAEVTSF